MSSEFSPESAGSLTTDDGVNAVAVAGAVFAAVAAVFYVVLFWQGSQLPSTLTELEAMKSNTSLLTRTLVLMSSAGLLNLVSLILGITGLLLPRRPRLLAWITTTASGLMFLGILTVFFLSTVASG